MHELTMLQSPEYVEFMFEVAKKIKKLELRPEEACLMSGIYMMYTGTVASLLSNLVDMP